MKIPSTLINADATGFFRPQGTAGSLADAGTRAARFIRPASPEGAAPGKKNSAPSPLDMDWSWIRRLVQRFLRDAMQPEKIMDANNHRENSENSLPATPIFSMDGDRADFGFTGMQNSGTPIYGKDDVDKPAPIEPKSDCGTCESRRYVDRSADSSVSYQTPTKINPQMSAMAVASHEREHVFNERAKADREGRQITSQTVSVQYATCPECNIMYAAGGTTRTQSVKVKEVAVAAQPEGEGEDGGLK